MRSGESIANKENKCNNYECRLIPDISSDISFRRRLQAWCNGSNLALKEKRQKPMCILPFQYRNMTYHGCSKLLEDDRKVKESDLLSPVFPDVFYCPTRNKNGKGKWRMGQCQDNCKTQFSKNSCATVGGGSCMFPFDFKGSKKDGCIWIPAAEGLWCKIGIKTWSQCSSSCRPDTMLEQCSYTSSKNRIEADFPYQCSEKKLMWNEGSLNEATAPYWLCKNIALSTRGTPTNIHQQGFCCHQNNCFPNQDPMPKHKTAGTHYGVSKGMIQSVVIPSALVVVSALIALIFVIRKRSKAERTAIQPDNSDDVFTQSPPPQILTRENEYTQPDVIKDVGKEPIKERNISTEAIFERSQQAQTLRTGGDASKLNPNISLNDQVNFIPYIPNRQMDRKDFTIGDILGNGNFGMVYKGKAKGLFYPDSETNVAMKTIHDTSNKNDIDSFLPIHSTHYTKPFALDEI